MSLWEEYLDRLRDKDLFSAKRIEKNQLLYQDCNPLILILIHAIDQWRQNQSMDVHALLDCYLEVNKMVIEEKMEFIRTGEYSKGSYEQVAKEVYHNTDYMTRYMIGLALTQVFWESHLQMFRFFVRCLDKVHLKSYLEVGAGHGLFLLFAAKHLSNTSDIRAVDISEASISMAKSMLTANGISPDKVRLVHGDFMKQNGHALSDFIMMGEILEHVPNPQDFLKKAHSLLNENGRLLATTAINSPAVDHIYHFRNVAQVETLFHQCGFTIEDKIIIPEKNCPESEWETRLLNINVSYLLIP